MLSERQLKLSKIVNEIDEEYGIGNGYVDESTGKSYMEKINKI